MTDADNIRAGQSAPIHADAGRAGGAPGSTSGGSPAGRVARLGMLLGVALALYAVESALPSPFPFMRIGLANVATLLALMTLGFADAVTR